MRALALGVVAAACGTSQPLDPNVTKLTALEPTINALHFTTSGTIATNPPPSVDVTVGSPRARSLYRAVLTLPPVGSGEISCPADFGIIYHLTFSNDQGEVATGALTPNGCEFADLVTSDASIAALGDDGTFWAGVASDLGIAATQIYPYLPPGA